MAHQFTEGKLEEAIISLLGEQGYPYTFGTDLDRPFLGAAQFDFCLGKPRNFFFAQIFSGYIITPDKHKWSGFVPN